MITGLLLRHSLRRARWLLLAVGLLLAGFQILLALVAANLHRSGAFGQIASMMPAFVRQILGPAVFPMLSFSGLICFGYFHPIVMATVVGLGIGLATEPAWEIETKFADLLLARPVARRSMITRSLLLCLLGLAWVIVMMLAGTWAGRAWLTPEGAVPPSTALLGALSINLAALALCWSGVALALGASLRRRSVAGAIAGLLALACFLIDYAARVWAPLSGIARLLPFHYYGPLELVMGAPLSASHPLVLIGVAAGGAAAAYGIYSRRDI